MNIIQNNNNNDDDGGGIYMEVVEDKEYFPELRNKDKGKEKNKYGILNLELQKARNVLTRHVWRYTYFDGVKLKQFSSFDLINLRHTVEENGYDWIVTDIDLARKTYDLNRKFMEEHELLKKEKENECIPAYHTISQSGVQYVYLNKFKGKPYWTYRNNKLGRTYTKKFLSDLRDLIIGLGYDWIVKDKELYNQVLNEEAEYKEKLKNMEN